MTFERDLSLNRRDLDISPGRLPLSVSVSESDGGVVVAVEGELDMSTAPTLREALVDVADGLESDLILDVRLLTFIDSSGLTLLVAEHKKISSLGHNLVILAPTSRTARLFQIVGLDEVLTVRPSV